MSNISELQALKMAWLAAKETGDTQTQLRLLRDHPIEQADLITFIAAYAATEGQNEEQPLVLTQRAMQTALERVFVGPQKSSSNACRTTQTAQSYEAIGSESTTLEC